MHNLTTRYRQSQRGEAAGLAKQISGILAPADAGFDAPVEPVAFPFRLVEGLLLLLRRRLFAAIDELEAVAERFVAGLIVADHTGRRLAADVVVDLKVSRIAEAEKGAIRIGRALATARPPILAPSKSISLVGGLGEGLVGGLSDADPKDQAKQKRDGVRSRQGIPHERRKIWLELNFKASVQCSMATLPGRDPRNLQALLPAAAARRLAGRRSAPCVCHNAAFCSDRRIMKKTIDSSRGTASLDL